MKSVRYALVAITFCICALAACSKPPEKAAETVIATPSPAGRYLGVWTDVEYQGRTIEVTQNGAGFIMKYQQDPKSPKVIMPVTFEPDGSMRTSRGTSGPIDISSGLMLFGSVTLKRTR